MLLNGYSYAEIESETKAHKCYEHSKSKTILKLHDWFESYSHVKWGIENGWSPEPQSLTLHRTRTRPIL